MEKKELFKTSERIVKIVGLSSPNTIATIAKDRGLNPLDVFVRVVFETEDGEQAQVSQKLRILTKVGYEKLDNARKNEELINLTVTSNGYFYVTESATLDDLFKDSGSTTDRIKSNLDHLNKIFNF